MNFFAGGVSPRYAHAHSHFMLCTHNLNVRFDKDHNRRRSSIFLKILCIGADYAEYIYFMFMFSDMGTEETGRWTSTRGHLEKHQLSSRTKDRSRKMAAVLRTLCIDAEFADQIYFMGIHSWDDDTAKGTGRWNSTAWPFNNNTILPSSLSSSFYHLHLAGAYS